MLKKISLALLIAFLAANTTAGLVLANDQPKQGKQAADTQPIRRGLVGKVLQVGRSDFTIEFPNGDTRLIGISAETIFRSRQGEQPAEASLADLTTGMWLAVFSQPGPAGNHMAHLVILLPEDFNPAQLRFKRVLGEIDKINPGQATFEVVTRNEETLTFQVDDQTRYAGSLASFDDLEKGMLVAVAAIRQEDGSMLAKLVGARDEDAPRLQKTNGKISQISAANLTVVSRQGEQFSFTITADTRFASRQGNIHGWEDLEIDMPVVVVHRPESDQAIALLVADPGLLQLEWVRGTIQSAGGSHLTLEVQGEKLRFTVDENTRLRGGGIEDLNDLKNGMKVLVLYIEKDGELLAKGILFDGPRSNNTN